MKQTMGYIHQPLPSPSENIRVLKLLASEEYHIVRCHLEICSLEENPFYIALSYEWGEPEPKVDILIDGKVFAIRHNLWLLLRQLRVNARRRRSYSDLSFWVDALCIDQRNIKEKNAQIPLMGRIYQQAASVFAWLGWPEGWDPLATFRFIKDTSTWSGFGDSTRDSPLWPTLFSLKEDRSHFYKIPNPDMWKMVSRMCESRYWSRRWIIQEVLLARDVIVMCGKEEIWWEYVVYLIQLLDFPKLADIFDGIRKMTETVPFTIGRHRNAIGASSTRKAGFSSLQDLILAYRSTQCEVSHDMIFSLLSLACDGGTITVDYSKSSEELFCNVISHCGWDSRGLSAYYKHWFNGSEYLKILAISLGLPKRDEEAAFAKEREIGSIPFEELHIRLSMRDFWRVDDSSLPWQVALHGPAVPRNIAQLLERPVRTSLRADNSSLRRDADDALLHTFCINSSHVRNVHPARKRKRVETTNLDDDDSTDDERPYISGPIRDDGDPRLLICDDGSIGCVCSNAQPGDLIIPFMERKQLVARKSPKLTREIIGTAQLSRREHQNSSVLHRLEKIISKKYVETDQCPMHMEALGISCGPDMSTIVDSIIRDEQSYYEALNGGIHESLSSLQALLSSGSRRNGRRQTADLTPETGLENTEICVTLAEIIQLTHGNPQSKGIIRSGIMSEDQEFRADQQFLRMIELDVATLGAESGST
jgi:hypothetical protein